MDKNKMKDLIKWSLYKETEFPILVGEFQVAGKHEFTSKVGKRKIEAVKKDMAADLKKALEEMLESLNG